MKLQRFIGKNTKSVLDEIRTTLGEEALIVSNTKVGSKTEIIAACESQIEMNEGKSLSINKESRKLVGETDSDKSFSSFMKKQEKPKTQMEEVDPWAYIKNIKQEINYIKSSIEQLPKLSSEIQKTSQVAIGSNDESEEQPSNIPRIELVESKGSHIIWGHRESGKSTLIKELLREEASTNKHITILRLPHKHSNNDPHLSAIAAEHSTNLIYINNLDQIEKMVEVFGKDNLALIEADLSLLPKIALAKDKTWLETSFHFLLDEDQEQTKLLLKLFSEINISKPTTLRSEDIKK